jgi:hypothetical protein
MSHRDEALQFLLLFCSECEQQYSPREVKRWPNKNQKEWFNNRLCKNCQEKK